MNLQSLTSTNKVFSICYALAVFTNIHRSAKLQYHQLNILTPTLLYLFAYLAPGCGVGTEGRRTAGSVVTTMLDMFLSSCEKGIISSLSDFPKDIINYASKNSCIRRGRSLNQSYAKKTRGKHISLYSR